jgi:hypothetical protein
MCVLLIYTAFFTAYQVAFFEANDTEQSYTLVMELIVMTMFFIDMVLKFNLAFPSVRSRAMITKRSSIAHRYLRSWFPLDFASTFPWDYLGTQTGSSTQLIRLLRLVKLLRLVRGNLVCDKVMKESNLKMSTWALLKTLVQVIVFVHWISCMWMLVGRAGGAHGWMSQYECDAPPLANISTGVTAAVPSRRLVFVSGSYEFDDEQGDLCDQADGSRESWYFLCIQFTMASLGVWPYGSPEPQTVAGERI